MKIIIMHFLNFISVEYHPWKRQYLNSTGCEKVPGDLFHFSAATVTLNLSKVNETHVRMLPYKWR